MNNTNKILGAVLMVSSVFISTLDRISDRISIAIVEAGYASAGKARELIPASEKVLRVYSYISYFSSDLYYWLLDSRGIPERIKPIGIPKTDPRRSPFCGNTRRF
ncbi:hypothetical protein ACX12E_28090 [Paenibacillus vandeheii]